MDCPDWDYCAGCIRRAPYLHNPAHRFQPIYEVEVAPEAPTQPATAASQRYIYIYIRYEVFSLSAIGASLT